jgi:hypothetical protein
LNSLYSTHAQNSRFETEIPHGLEIARFDVKMLPAGWHETRDKSLRAFGDDWIRDGKSVALPVQSVAIRGEWNILLNPVHRDYSVIPCGLSLTGACFYGARSPLPHRRDPFDGTAEVGPKNIAEHDTDQRRW